MTICGASLMSNPLLHTSTICLTIMLSSGSMLKNERQNIPRNACKNLPNGIFVENEKGCKYFLYCRNERAIEGFCPDGMWFNFDAGVCDHPKNVDCQLNDSTASNAIEDELVQDESEKIKCPSKDSSKIRFIASKWDCSRYYICYHGRAVRQQCMNHLHWNMDQKKCDHPKTARCKVNIAVPSVTCPSRKEPIFLPHPNHCEYFIFCQNGIPTLQQCPFYHHWDVVTQTCKWKEIANCLTNQNQ